MKLRKCFGYLTALQRADPMKVIEVIVSPTGETSVQTKGFAGNTCLQASKFIEDALGVSVSDVKTAEYYGVSETQHQQVNQ